MRDAQEPIDEYPVITEGLIRLLDEQFPMRLPEADGSERQDVYHAGARSVVDFLRMVHEHQIERASEQRG
ncbi:MAG: hypothetical protein GY701_28735 [Sulfitobacter sp.]|nr:hypothetical protein [Sulfitobacter sp.]